MVIYVGGSSCRHRLTVAALMDPHLRSEPKREGAVAVPRQHYRPVDAAPRAPQNDLGIDWCRASMRWHATKSMQVDHEGIN